MIVLIALFLLLVSLPATILLMALTIVGSAVAATAEGTLVAPESRPSATPDPGASAAA